MFIDNFYYIYMQIKNVKVFYVVNFYYKMTYITCKMTLTDYI